MSGLNTRNSVFRSVTKWLFAFILRWVYANTLVCYVYVVYEFEPYGNIFGSVCVKFSAGY